MVTFIQAVNGAVRDNSMDDSGERNTQTIAQEFGLAPDLVRSWTEGEEFPDLDTQEKIRRFIIDRELNRRSLRPRHRYDLI